MSAGEGVYGIPHWTDKEGKTHVAELPTVMDYIPHIKQPYCCPVCHGKGAVPTGLYDGTAAICTECPACKGTCIVWG